MILRGGGGGGNFRPGGKHHTAQSGSESSAHCTWYVLIIVHVYKHWEGSTRFRGGGGTIFRGIGLCNGGIFI